MKAKDMREKVDAELTTSLQVVRKRLGELYFDLAAGRVKNVKEVASLRREQARIKTIMRERKKKVV